MRTALGLSALPAPAPAAQPTRTDFAPSVALSILVGNGFDAALLNDLGAQIAAAGGMVKIIALRIVGVMDSASKPHPAHEMLSGGKSVLYNAVAILTGAQDAAPPAAPPAAQDFLLDAHAHRKFIAHAGLIC